MPLDSSGGGRRRSVNVFGGALEPCSFDPLTGFHRDGCCATGPQDVGSHTVCAVMTAEFLAFSRARGNDLSTPLPAYGFPGLAPGARWCLCAPRWQEAFLARGRAPCHPARDRNGRPRVLRTGRPEAPRRRSPGPVRLRPAQLTTRVAPSTRKRSIASKSQEMPRPGTSDGTALPSLTVMRAVVTASSCGMYSTQRPFGTAQASATCSSMRKCGHTATLNASARCAVLSHGVIPPMRATSTCTTLQALRCR